MLKLLYKPTGNVFTLPDEEALRIKKSDEYNYEILEAGLQEETQEQLTPQEIGEIVQEKEELRLAEQEEKTETTEEVVEEKKSTLNYDDMKKEDMEIIASKLGIANPHGYRKADLREKIREITGE